MKVTELGRKIADMSKTELEKAKEIHEKSIVIDGSEVLRLDPIALPRRKRGGITAANVTCPDKSEAGMTDAYREICEQRAFIDYYEDKALLVTATEDIRKAKKEDKFGIILGPQNGHPLIERLEDVAFYKWAGIRIIQLTYNLKNAIGDGCAERTNCGLSNFGVNIVEEMNKHGIVVDLSHCGDQTTLEAIKISKDPCIFSHASVRSVQDQARNKSDEAIHALAEKGGVIAICSWGPILRVRDNPPKIEDIYAHVKYVEDLVGIDHIGLATDVNERRQPGTPSYGRPTGDLVMEFSKMARSKLMIDYMKMPPREVVDTWRKEGRWYLPEGYGGEGFQDFTKVLVAGGYSDQEIQKILGGNLLKAFERVWGK